MLLDTHQEPITETSLSTYFRKHLSHHAQGLRPPPHEDTCWYLGSLLDRFSRCEQLYTWEDGRMVLRPLALLYGDALQASNERERCLLLQRLGDTALFMGALFPERYARRGLRRDYFIGMGGGAYDYLAGHSRQHRHIFEELARTFARMLGLVASACSRGQPASAGDVMELHQRWRETGDPIAERQLRDLGITLENGDRLH